MHRLSDRWFNTIAAAVVAIIAGPPVGIGAQIINEAAREQPCVVGSWHFTAYQQTMTDGVGE